jgi:uncharacterized metal-binding protein YceD (DUF177 family)
VARPLSEPWPHSVSWRDVGAGARGIDLAADEAARTRVAKALDLEAVNRLEAHASLTPWLDGVRFEGRLSASVIRTCGVTLEPFEEVIDQPFALSFVPAGSPNAPAPADGEDQEIDLEADDPPEVVAGDSIDLGHALVEELSLALDPFPRAPGAVFEAPQEDGPISPFAALAALKATPKDD